MRHISLVTLPTPPRFPALPIRQALEARVQAGEQRLARLEVAAEASSAAAALVRSSSTGSRGDTLAALQAGGAHVGAV